MKCTVINKEEMEIKNLDLNFSCITKVTFDRRLYKEFEKAEQNN